MCRNNFHNNFSTVAKLLAKKIIATMEKTLIPVSLKIQCNSQDIAHYCFPK